MYTMDKDKLPKKPVITSFAAADAEARTWLRENQYDTLKDADGHTWSLGLKITHTPDSRDPRHVLWTVTIQINTRMGAADLTGGGVLDPVKDRRLLDLIANDSIELKMKPLVYSAPGENELNQLMASVIPRLKSSFVRNSLIGIKRSLTSRYIDSKGVFGGHPVREESPESV